MKINIWVKKEEAISGKITEYHLHIPQPGYQNYVQVLVTQDEFATLEDSKHDNVIFESDLSDGNDWGSDHWLTKQYNRNRDHKDQVKSKKDIPYIYERNPDTGDVFRRRSGDYTSPRELIKDSKKDTATLGLGERFYASDKELEELKKEMKKKTGADFMSWFHKLTKNEQTKLAAYYND